MPLGTRVHEASMFHHFLQINTHKDIKEQTKLFHYIVYLGPKREKREMSVSKLDAAAK
jgi:hypothetical protein